MKLIMTAWTGNENVYGAFRNKSGLVRKIEITNALANQYVV